MKPIKILESPYFKIQYIEEPDDTFIALHTFNKERLFQIIDTELSMMEILFSDIRMLSYACEKFQIRVMNPEKDNFVLNINFDDKTFFFVINACKYFSWVSVAAIHCVNFLMQNKMLPVSFSKKTLTQIVTDLDDNVIVFFDDDFFGKDEEKPEYQEPEIKIPILMGNPDKRILN